MSQNKLEEIIQNFIVIAPLFKKKLVARSRGCSTSPFNHSHFQIMIVLNEDGMMPISEVGKKLFISTPNMTKLLNKLIDEEIIERIPDKNDRRIINIDLTDKGRSYLDEQFKNIQNSLKERLSTLSDDRIDQLYISLENLKDILNEISSED